ncbi:MAG: carbon dioxide concentrating mechanism protein CcmL [Planctomycetes bacterium]|nr:carbon dioxide concentrating mechanism protein CcmL [Planctomycetota bacterium]
MRIAKIIGTVTLNEMHPSFRGSCLKLAVPLSLDDLTGRTEPAADPVVVWDELGAGIGDRIAMSEGPEASQPFRPEVKPVDAYNTAILDHLDIRLDT